MTMVISLFSLFFFMIISFTLSSSRPINFSNADFTVKIFHRDSPKSPLYNSTETHFQRLAKTLRRSISRSHHFSAARLLDTPPQAPVVNNRGEYLMEISLGTPPFPILAVADTGSDIIWTQCLPCVDCFSQSSPIFNPKKSNTYKQLPCSSSRCSSAFRTSCAEQSQCRYSVHYGDGSHSYGDIAIDTVTLHSSTSKSTVSFPQIVIGCGHDNAGVFDSNITGIVGLGGGSESLVAQMGSSKGGKFSYCLTSLTSKSLDSGNLNFGKNAIVSGEGTVSTPIYKGTMDTFYILNLKGISVGSSRFDYDRDSSSSSSSVFGTKGNMIIDSGTTITILPNDLFSRVATAVSDEIKYERVDDPGRFFQYCFESESDDYEAPVISVHFEGADLELNKENGFIRVAEGVVCLAFVDTTEDGIPIYGNVAQSNFLVGYDTDQMLVSFKPVEC